MRNSITRLFKVNPIKGQTVQSVVNYQELLYKEALSPVMYNQSTDPRI